MKHYLYASAAAAMLACALMTAPAHASESLDISKLEQATVADLAAAKADADAHNDTFASQCYGGVSDYITANGADIALLQVVGVASAFQVARDGVKIAESGRSAVPPELVQACGPLALDVQNDIGKAAGFTVFGLKF